ncbi:MAG: prolipoprotein diacylglyceryl transferase, partial [Anaerolineae bacterium]|nr:prolipoprotein diacylglyceryl transferase [Anaerolineae bacterium]
MPIVAFRVGAEPFFTYSLLMALALLAGVLSLTLEARRRGWASTWVLELVVSTLAAAVVAGRLGYVLVLGPDEATHRWPFLRPWGEGLL